MNLLFFAVNSLVATKKATKRNADEGKHGAHVANFMLKPLSKVATADFFLLASLSQFKLRRVGGTCGYSGRLSLWWESSVNGHY